jgi:hypothetical protein
MPKPVKKKRKRTPPRNMNQWARHMVEASAAEPEIEAPAPKPKPRISKELRAYMLKLGKRGGEISGARRMKNLSDEQRREIASKAARAMWAKRKRASRG